MGNESTYCCQARGDRSDAGDVRVEVWGCCWDKVGRQAYMGTEIVERDGGSTVHVVMVMAHLL